MSQAAHHDQQLGFQRQIEEAVRRVAFGNGTPEDAKLFAFVGGVDYAICTIVKKGKVKEIGIDRMPFELIEDEEQKYQISMMEEQREREQA